MGNSNLAPYKRHAVSEVSDGEGGFVTTITGSSTIYMNVITHDNTRNATVRSESDLNPNDLVEMQDGLYRVEPTIHYIEGGLFKYVELVRVERPLVPLPGSDS